MALELEVWQAPIVDNEGSIQPGAQVTVFNSDDTIATIYDDLNRTPRSNPFNVGSDALARFYAEPGRYRVQAQVGSDIAVFDNVDISQKAHRLDLHKPESGIPQAIQLREDLAESDSHVLIAGKTARSVSESVEFTDDLKSEELGKGAALIRRGVISVDSIQELRDLPTSVRRADITVLLGENPTGSGVFKWVGSSDKIHNGVLFVKPEGLEGTGIWKRIDGSVGQSCVVSIPTDYPDPNSAILDNIGLKFKSDVEIQVNLESGYELLHPIHLRKCDASNFTITSDDEIVNLATGFVGADTQNAIMKCVLSHAPIWDIKIDADGHTGHGLSYWNCSYFKVEPGKGVDNCNGGTSTQPGIYALASVGAANAAIFNGCNRGAWISRGSNFHFESGDVSGSINNGLYVSMASMCSFNFGKANDCGTSGVSSLGSNVSATSAEANRCNTGFDCRSSGSLSCADSEATECVVGYNAEHAGQMRATGANADNCADRGFQSDFDASIACRGSTAINCGVYGYRAARGGTMDATNTDATGAGSQGYFVTDGGEIVKSGGTGTQNITSNWRRRFGLITDTGDDDFAPPS